MAEEQATGKVAMIWVPNDLAENVRDYAAALVEEQKPDVEGYAALVKGMGEVGKVPGGIGSISRGGMVNALSGTDCAITLAKNDFMCGDDD